MKLHFLIGFMSLFLCINNPLASSISLSESIIDFNHEIKKRFIDIPVTNTDKNAKAYVKIVPFEILNPGTKDEKRVEIKGKIKDTLIVSPKKMVIPNGSARNLRLVPMFTNVTEDKIFRVRVEPVIGGADSDESSLVTILIAYDVLVMIRPKQDNTSYDIKRKGSKIMFKNTGNTNILIRNSMLCPAEVTDKNSDSCNKAMNFRLYAGNKKIVDLKDFATDKIKDINSSKIYFRVVEARKNVDLEY
ncbi:hypothetical protein N8772_03755 [Rickettsiales bacterium]|nr:hypothetical protein [Rickettsiales bacterium]MDB2550702.1 hypothetical protein [Rickettsiales bacterium]